MVPHDSALQLTVRWLARAISTLAAGFWLLLLLDIIACDALVGFVCVNWEMAVLLGLAAFSLLCVILSWWRESVGGLLMILWGIAFSLVAFVTSPARRAYSILVSGVPFLIAGILFLASWWFEQTGIKSTKAV
jgi:hypothetical protein